MEENDDETKNTADIEFTQLKTDPDNDENAIEFKWSDAQEDDEDIAKANSMRAYKKSW